MKTKVRKGQKGIRRNPGKAQKEQACEMLLAGEKKPTLGQKKEKVVDPRSPMGSAE